MKIIEGDILNITDGYIVQQNNCITTKAMGLALDLSKKFPGSCPYDKRRPDKDNRRCKKEDEGKMGTISIYDTGKGVHIINLFGQYYPGEPKYKDTKEKREEAFRNGLNAIVDYFKVVRSKQSTQSKKAKIYFPFKIGCGLAKGEWKRYYEMLEEFQENMNNEGIPNSIKIVKKGGKGESKSEISRSNSKDNFDDAEDNSDDNSTIKDDIKFIIKKINKLPLSEIKTYLESINIKTLKSVRDYLNELYHNGEEPEMEDSRFDMIERFLKDKVKSPKIKVGASLRTGDNRVNLPYWLGSTDKITPDDFDELERWKKSHKNKYYIITEKLDGVSCLLYYNDGKYNLYTRGDGTVGADISYLSNHFDLPEYKSDESFYIRGELIIPRNVFDNKYKNKVVNGREYKNPRNMVSGLIGSKTCRVGLEDIQFVPYEIIRDENVKQSEQLKILSDLGFEKIKSIKVKYEDLTITKLKEYLINFKKDSVYDIDGIIITIDDVYDRNTSGNPDYMFAFKMTMTDDIRETVIVDMEWNTSKWGQLKPVAILKPVILNDVTITRASAHHAKNVIDNKLGIGAIIKVVRSKDVIPYILEVVQPSDNIKMPNVTYYWDKTKTNIVTDEDDSDKCIKLISNFFHQLKIKFVSEETVRKMYNNGLDNLIKMVSASKKRLLEIPEFQDKSAERIYTNIRNGLTDVSLAMLLGSSGIFGIGVAKKRLDMLLLEIPDLLTTKESKIKIYNKILKVEGFSEIMTERIVNNLKYARLFLEKIKPYCKIKENKRVSDTLSGKKIVMSGFRDKDLEDAIASRGGKVVGSISKNTDYLLVKKGGKSGSKVEKAKQLGVKIYDKDEFISEYIV